jgi:hypothetical protein
MAFWKRPMQKKLQGEEMNFRKLILVSKNLILLPVFCILMSFGVREPNYCKIARRIAGIYAIKFALPRGLQLTSYGGAMMGDIQEIELRFLSLNILSVETARLLYVEMMEEFLARINQNDKIRPYLHDCPFGVKNIKLVIGFDDDNGHILGDGHVAHMFIGRNDTLYYEAYNLEGLTA